MKISTIQKRFLIIWIAFHLLALATNIIPIRGSYKEPSDCAICSKEMYVFAAPVRSENNGFWPFVKIYDEDGYGYGNPYLRGIFYSYDISEFIFYVAFGICIIILPMLWKKH